jgi:hypothetical protein
LSCQLKFEALEVGVDANFYLRFGPFLSGNGCSHELGKALKPARHIRSLETVDQFACLAKMCFAFEFRWFNNFGGFNLVQEMIVLRPWFREQVPKTNALWNKLVMINEKWSQIFNINSAFNDK